MALQRPPGYKGKLYDKVTSKHWLYLEALAEFDRPVTNREWCKAVTRRGWNTQIAPGTMIRGVFEARKWIEVLPGKPQRYRLTDEGRRALARYAVQDSLEEAQNPEPLLAKEDLPSETAPSVDIIRTLLREYAALRPSRVRKINVQRYERSKIGNWLKKLYDGRCQICGFTFRDRFGRNFAEVHHLEHLARGGVDAPSNMIVVCANCHRMFHYAQVSVISWENETLRVKINDQEKVIRFDPDHWACIHAGAE